MPWTLRIGRVVAALVLALLGAARAPSGDQRADEILRACDEALNRFEDYIIDFDVRSQDPLSDQPRQMKIKTFVKGKKSLTEFLAPGDLKGTRVLVISTRQVYIYLPQFFKVRRVASHALEQGFMGTTFTQDDMSAQWFAQEYSAELAEEDDRYWVLHLTRRPRSELSHPMARFKIRKDIELPEEIQWLDAEKRRVKTDSRTDYRCEGDICFPYRWRMVDHTKNDKWSELHTAGLQINTGLRDGMFSVRELQRGG